MAPEPLPEYRVKARNTSAHGDNPIHDDTVARRYGFPGGLVPGVTVYAYLTHPLVQALGVPWIARGTASVRFLRPILDGEEVTVEGAITDRDPHAVGATVTARTAAGPCATLAATLPAGLPTPVNGARYPAGPLPAERPPVSREHLARLDALGSPETMYDMERAADYLASVAEALPLYRGAEGVVPPAFFLVQANRAVDQNVRLGPWIHTGSVVRHLGLGRVGERLQTRGRVRSLFERKGREYVELDLVVYAGDPGRPVAHVHHTAIYRLPAVAPAGDAC
jgi:acyl dehydratase